MATSSVLNKVLPETHLNCASDLHTVKDDNLWHEPVHFGRLLTCNSMLKTGTWCKDETENKLSKTGCRIRTLCPSWSLKG